MGTDVINILRNAVWKENIPGWLYKLQYTKKKDK
jgi:hypothetical protein